MNFLGKCFLFFSISFGMVVHTTYANELTPKELNTKLFFAAKGGFLPAVKQLIEMGADVNSTQASNETPLHAAASTGRLNIVKLLKSKGAKDNPRTLTGWVPLHHAVRFGHVQVVNYLLTKGTPLYIRTNQGQTVFDLAKATKNQRMINLLEYWRKKPRK